MHAIGIDFGTSTSEIGTFVAGDVRILEDISAGSKTIPSAVAVNDDGNVIVGHEALKYEGLEGRFVSQVKRLMGTDTEVELGNRGYRPEEIAALIMGKLKSSAEKSFGASITEAVISVPANFPEPARRATMDAAEIAGLKVLRLINEPTAAAVAFGSVKSRAKETALVFDWGGGTLDLTVLGIEGRNVNVIASYGDLFLGGSDFDEAMAEYLESSLTEDEDITIFAHEALRKEARRVKEALSFNDTVDLYLPAAAKKADGTSVKLERPLSREEMNRVVSHLIDRAREVVDETLSMKNVEYSEVDRVILVGGTTYVPAVREMLQDLFPGRVSTSVDPDLAVCIGGTYQAAIMKGLVVGEDQVITSDISPYGLGLEVLEQIGNSWEFIYDPLIEPNTTLPFETNVEYDLLSSEQRAVNIRVLQSHRNTKQLAEEAIDTGIHARIAGIPQRRDTEPHTLRIDFSYDANGMIHLSATIVETKQSITIDFSETEVSLTEQDKLAAKHEIMELLKHM
ncbi:MAG TPA: molecular chaperone DnaK [Kosmotogaceae bacterium]|nr:MAG: DnaK protein [Thermotogales bacterium 46_20]HAA84847.1 molecular chaperone DnaK [Kosmotogaceae bacterium]